MYAGNLGELQGLEPLVDAFSTVPNATLVLVGGGVARRSLEDRVRRGSTRNVVFVDAQPTERIGDFIAASDVQVVSLRDTPLLRATMPSKVQGSMASGRPILAHAVGDAADLIVGSGAGVSTPPGDVEAAARAISRMAEMPADQLREMGRNGRRRYEADFSPRAGLDRLESMLMSAAGQERKDER
jgi:glycosyltransferase involved in cell wall biosynthesis